ncbi:MAG: metalloregulator ArsR/SmtB family transcription factor [Armatimonadetes bacterium]|nr:metalloregulator ArsR/SmtB family transcription factor [Armatimonadota bacterium]MBS1701737.1 metalloregulator ArsR/SmtB family transcription factor [Armatimonadota bacterium]
MRNRIDSHYLHVNGGAGAEVFKALGSETRLEILSLLVSGDRNINEICLHLNLSQPTISKHMQILEQVGLVVSEYLPGTQGMQKRCRLRYDQMIVSFESSAEVEERVEEVSMPVGLYSVAEAMPQCGLANREKIIGFLDVPQAFLDPERATAEILWMAGGYVEYIFPNSLPAAVEILRMEFICEACSEAPNYNHDWPSDITLWVNDTEVGTWTSPGDFGAKRGALNPSWWIDHMTQYGALKIWSIDREGSSLDGNPVSGITLAQANVRPNQPVRIRVGVKRDAVHRGGFNLFGKGFGNYAQDLVLRLHYVMNPTEAADRPVLKRSFNPDFDPAIKTLEDE